MKIATFNINSIRNRLPQLLAWLASATPDVVCLQELRDPRRRFPARGAARRRLRRDLAGQKPRYNGVAILARGRRADRSAARPARRRRDTQARYIEAAVDGVLVACLYAPNGNPQPGPKFDYKLAWLARLIATPATLLDVAARRSCSPATTTSCRPLPTSTRRARTPTTRWCSPQSREAFRRLLDAGLDRRHPRAPSRRERSTRSGTTCASAGNATPACASIICC